MSVTYSIFSTPLETEERTATYGIRAICGGECIAEIADVATEPETLEALAVLCTQLELEPCHLSDVVDDFLYDLKD